MEVWENDTKSKPKGPPLGAQEDFPWSNFASLAMYNFINQSEVKPIVTTYKS